MIDQRIITFLCVCENMNYTKASQELHITQPAVSQHILNEHIIITFCSLHCYKNQKISNLLKIYLKYLFYFH